MTESIQSQLATSEAPAPVSASSETPAAPATFDPTTDTPSEPPMSKNQMKKLKRKLAWEAGAEDRKRQRREKMKARKERRKTENAQKTAVAIAAGIDLVTLFPRTKRKNPVKVPVSLIIDCDFEQYMSEKELISLSSQITRSYSENKRANFRTHLVMSSWKGKLKERYETVFAEQFKHWKDVMFIGDDFVSAAKQMKDVMSGANCGKVIDTLRTPSDNSPARHPETDEPIPAEYEESDCAEDIVYLSSDSPYVIERLEPGVSYVIGGIVDKNREKGLCYKIARERKVHTAKLPIGDYMVMQSRQVLTTNQVVEIMLRWLEVGDWGQAFLSVIPKRKGGRLREDAEVKGSRTTQSAEVQEEDEHDDSGEKAEKKALQDAADVDAEEAAGLPAADSQD